MKEHRKDRNAPQPDDRMTIVEKKPYASPVLVEYGTIAKLTQGSKTRSNDGINTQKLMACL